MCFCLSHSLCLWFWVGFCLSQCLSLSVCISESISLYAFLVSHSLVWSYVLVWGFVSVTLFAGVSSQMLACSTACLCLFVSELICLYAFKFFSLSLCLWVWVWVCLSRSLTLYVCISESMYFYMFLSLSLSLSVCLGGCLLVPMPVFIDLYSESLCLYAFFVSHSLQVCVWVGVCLSQCLSLSFFMCESMFL
jgi:hypothetical protein